MLGGAGMHVLDERAPGSGAPMLALDEQVVEEDRPRREQRIGHDPVVGEPDRPALVVDREDRLQRVVLVAQPRPDVSALVSSSSDS